jgi:hypothetical protein
MKSERARGRDEKDEERGIAPELMIDLARASARTWMERCGLVVHAFDLDTTDVFTDTRDACADDLAARAARVIADDANGANDANGADGSRRVVAVIAQGPYAAHRWIFTARGVTRRDVAIPMTDEQRSALFIVPTPYVMTHDDKQEDGGYKSEGKEEEDEDEEDQKYKPDESIKRELAV